MATTVLVLTGLSCKHCINRVQQALQDAGIEQAQITLHYAKIDGNLSAVSLIETICYLGYGATLAQPTISLRLSGLSCGRCVKSVEQALVEFHQIELYSVTKTQADIYGDIDPAQVIAKINELGYQAELISAEQENHLNPQLVSNSDLNTAVKKSEIIASEDYSQISLFLTGLSCAACVLKVENALLAVPNVINAQVNFAEHTAFIQGNVDVQRLVQAVGKAGYGAEVIENETTRQVKQLQQAQREIKQRQWQSALALVFGFGLMLWGLVSGSMAVTEQNQAIWIIVGVITLWMLWLTGSHFYSRAWKNLKLKTATMDTLVALGTGTAWLYSMLVATFPHFFPEQTRHLYFESSLMIIGLINVGKILEVKAKQRTSNALSQLVSLTPKNAWVVDEKGEREIPLAEVKKGMMLRLKTGDRIAVDGIVCQGSAWVDESMLTGEPLPVQKNEQDQVKAGTFVVDGSLRFKAQQVGEQTQLANIIKLVRQAQNSKPKIAQTADKISSVFVPVVMTIALLAGLIWYLYTHQIAYAFVVFTSVLIIACPCALGLATPMSIISGVGRAAEFGILVRDADVLQKASEIDCIVLDKTGTLTAGLPTVSAIYPFNQYNSQQALQYAASLEQGSQHPLAKAIIAEAKQQALTLLNPTEFCTHNGLGVSGMINEYKVVLGNLAFLQQQGVDCQQAEQMVHNKREQGATRVYLAMDNALSAIFAIQDQLRNDSIGALSRLKLNYELIMLTGDHITTAQAMAKQAGIEQVIAGVLPEQKAQAINALQQQGKRVAMVGDGINDAPALAQANVSMAMGSGSDIAIETADLTLLRHSLHTVADSLQLAKATWRNMQQNLFFAFIYNIIGIPIATGILYPWTGVLLNPMIAGAAMACSSITVVLNANRLLSFRVKN